LLTVLAASAALLLPLAAAAQVNQESGSAAPEKPAPSFKYEVYAGYGYTSINMVNQARHGLQGGEASVTRDFGTHFGITADGSYYKLALGSNPANPGNPAVTLALAGPEFHFLVWGPVAVFARGLMGVEHVAGNNQTPNISFAGGLGGGLDYGMGRHFAFRASGDDILSSFSVTNPVPGDSAHMTRSSRASFGFVYKF
jgi:opacity protein-like surface antigen